MAKGYEGVCKKGVEEVMATTSAKREYHPVEKRLVSEYVRQRWPGALVWERPRLGPYKPPAFGTEERAVAEMWGQVTRRYPDAIVGEDHTLWIIEGKVIGDAAAVGQLEHYKELLKDTEEFKLYRTDEIKLLLVCYQITDELRKWIEERGIEVDTYSADWLERYLLKRQYR